MMTSSCFIFIFIFSRFISFILFYSPPFADRSFFVSPPLYRPLSNAFLIFFLMS